LWWGVAVLVVLFVLLCLPFNPPKVTAAEIGAKVDLLNENAAIVTPHCSAFGRHFSMQSMHHLKPSSSL